MSGPGLFNMNNHPHLPTQVISGMNADDILNYATAHRAARAAIFQLAMDRIRLHPWPLPQGIQPADFCQESGASFDALLQQAEYFPTVIRALWEPAGQVLLESFRERGVTSRYAALVCLVFTVARVRDITQATSRYTAFSALDLITVSAAWDGRHLLGMREFQTFTRLPQPAVSAAFSRLQTARDIYRSARALRPWYRRTDAAIDPFRQGFVADPDA
ncbi:uncharacterized protein STEHIDRAFT_112635 [Stereum hirsutum FP-91666 SS1]|uniref:uncharacterized protein n=1 Tax=Stereum hirsutum (strain FP-91666) TaxID=721885 RepID=UPI000444A6EE|nr:uncharacterized protein STEHIDRAFT_112635 [Stereum hirsutum FP-91666 SS1]EIM84190.1 hypothetical protein STEHIDRAFT_112635 [Stereum hirsutum FP-91666 SS1]